MLDRISFDQMQALVCARTDQGTKRALNAALNGINDTERTIRTKIATLRAALDETETQLDRSLHADGDLIQRAATDLDRAAATRRIHWTTTAALLTETELANLAITTT
jgi:hypothetical protein